ncbi:MAG: acetyl-CoA carboxylase biotin carboxyl carrier protein [Thermoleophilaceae bacterium]
MNDDKKMIESTWAEARDLVRQLEGTSVQRFAVKAGDYEIEIERGAIVQPAATGAAEMPQISGQVAHGAAAGPGVAPGARGASGVFTMGDAAQEVDNRVPVLAPLVGSFYRASQPGAKPFVQVGDVVELGQTVCIVEAMKLMNEIAAGDAGKVVEILVEDGEAVEFEQILMYLEPASE